MAVHEALLNIIQVIYTCYVNFSTVVLFKLTIVFINKIDVITRMEGLLGKQLS